MILGRSRASALLLAAAVIVLAGCSAQPAPAPTPTSTKVPGVIQGVTTIAAMGDSMSLGVNACSTAGPCIKESWAVGTDPTVDSIAQRIGAANGTTPRTIDAAASGAKVSQLLGSVDNVIAEKPQLVTVLIGANDACAPSFDAMTSTADFTTAYDQVITQLSAGLPDAHILAMSVPDLNRLWEVGHTNAQVAALWQKAPNCRSLLYNAASTAQADVDRRAQVQQRVESFNSAIAAACSAAPNCIGDGGAMYDHSFQANEISTIDAFHPSVAGQQAIASIAWAALQKASG